ncbi:MAG: ABC transporter permease, partial [Clostridiales bacterium]|nr:ABC transporter permease [Clostridiales bacterium]
MLEKRSREFGTYLLLGMKKKQISRMYLRENLLLGTIAFIVGCPIGWLLEQIILSIFDSMFNLGYEIEVSFSGYGMLMTVGCYLTCFMLALLRNKRKFNSFNINALMTMDQKNEKISENNGFLRILCFFGSIAYFIAFICYICTGNVTIGGVMIGGFLFIVAIYLFYIGISAFVVKIIKNQKNHLFKKQHLFLYRQLSVKLKTMQFTMGTLTVLFTVALLFGTMSMMLSKFQKERADHIFPFDVILFSEDVDDTFEQEKEEIRKDHNVEETIIYNVYENGSSEMNEYLYTNLTVIGDSYKNQDGSTNHKKIEE